VSFVLSLCASSGRTVLVIVLVIETEMVICLQIHYFEYDYEYRFAEHEHDAWSWQVFLMQSPCCAPRSLIPPVISKTPVNTLVSLRLRERIGCMTRFDPVNVLKYCPRCGEKEFNARRADYFICEQCGFEFFINAVAAVAGLILDGDGRLLLTVRGREPHKGMLDLPGGFVDVDETAEDALRREMKEELNFEIEDLRYLFSYPNHYPYNGLTYFTLDLAFACTITDFSQLRVDDDVAGVEFIRLDEVDLNRIGGESIKRIVSNYRTMKVES